MPTVEETCIRNKRKISYSGVSQTVGGGVSHFLIDPDSINCPNYHGKGSNRCRAQHKKSECFYLQNFQVMPKL